MEANSGGANLKAGTSTDGGDALCLPTRESFTNSSVHKPKKNNLSSTLNITTSAIGKGRHAEPNTTETHADPANLSMPPPLIIPKNSISRSQVCVPPSRRESSHSGSWSEEAALLRSASIITSPSCLRDFAINTTNAASATAVETDDFETPRLQPGATIDETAAEEGYLPEPALITGGRSSFSDAEVGKRVSVSSMYSVLSARGVNSSAASANSSDTGATPALRTVSGLMASSASKGPATSQPEASVSNMTVTTASQGAQVGAHHLAPRESHMPNLNDMVKKPSAPAQQQQQQQQQQQPASSGPTVRPQPTRSRSRAKRRFSGSTAASSHSPSSDRAVVHRERTEKEDIKPAPFGVIGVCALDVKARSKPSRNILNRLIQNREFDVCVFGDKVILDEGK